MRQFFVIFFALVCTTAFAQSPLSISRSRIALDCPRHDIRRCVRLDVSSADIPAEFDGVTMAFITDIHYASRFDSRSLQSLKNSLIQLHPDIVLLGGDYQEGCDFVEPLFSAISACHPRLGSYGVLGNNDYERCTDIIRCSMATNNITLLENSVDSIYIGQSHIIIAGAKNTFHARESIPSPTLSLSTSDFVVLLTHTPDYIEDVDCSNTDFALAGHLHGGQVTLFGLFAPVLPSHYGQHFRHGIKYNSQGIPVLCSNGIGTSRKAIRFCAAPEIHLIVLHANK